MTDEFNASKFTRDILDKWNDDNVTFSYEKMRDIIREVIRRYHEGLLESGHVMALSPMFAVAPNREIRDMWELLKDDGDTLLNRALLEKVAGNIGTNRETFARTVVHESFRYEAAESLLATAEFRFPYVEYSAVQQAVNVLLTKPYAQDLNAESYMEDYHETLEHARLWSAKELDAAWDDVMASGDAIHQHFWFLNVAQNPETSVEMLLRVAESDVCDDMVAHYLVSHPNVTVDVWETLVMRIPYMVTYSSCPPHLVDIVLTIR